VLSFSGGQTNPKVSALIKNGCFERLLIKICKQHKIIEKNEIAKITVFGYQKVLSTKSALCNKDKIS